MGKKHLIAAEAEGDQRSLWGEAWRRFKKNRLAMIGMYFILALVIIAIATIIIDAVTGKSIYLNYVVKQDLRGRLQGPSLAHPFGLDEFGRDMLLRMLWAVRYSLFMGTVAIVISCIFGGLLGAFAGYYGKTADNIIMRIMDILLAIPSMLLAIAIVAALGTSITNVLIAIAISYVPTFARTVRASVLTAEDTGKLPMNELATGSGTDRKTMERHRKYLVAILLAFTNGYEIIRGHLCQIGSKKGGGEA